MSGAEHYREFSLADPLPGPGIHVLEASAGTGKTYTITKLVARFIAEDVATIDQLLVMTFSRSAAQELRDRVRRELRDFTSSSPEHRERIELAAANLDQATISTTHQFCLDAFSRLGIRADADKGETTGADLTEIIDEVAEDVYLQIFADVPPPAADTSRRLSPGEAHDLARKVALDPVSRIVPDDDPDPEQGRRIEFARRVRSEIELRKHRARLVSFDDLVLRLRDALRDPLNGPGVAEHLRQRYRVVLIDEFQDTDPSQWDIVRTAFAEPTRVILIGDPKQGIYAFRGADIYSYLAAVDAARTKRTLGTNFRSDASVIDGLGELIGGLALGDEKIVVHPVKAEHSGERIRGAALRRERVRVRLFDPGNMSVPATREHIANDVAAEILRTLRSGAELLEDDHWRALQPKDFAVIVRTNRQADLMAQTLRSVGLPAVINSRTSVFASEAAQSWLQLLRALERPRPETIRMVALTDFFGARAADLAKDDTVVEEIAGTVRQWRGIFDKDGVAALAAAVVEDSGIFVRALSREGGQRTVTDLRHVAGLLHEEQLTFRRGITGLADWLAEQVSEALQSADEDSEALTRRLETDADAVKVVTIHSCKGLEYKITYIPFGWQSNQFNEWIIVCHEDDQRVIDVRTGDGTDRDRRKAQRLQETRAEDLRLLYVALTRGKHEVVVHWAGHNRTTKASPLHRALSALEAGGSQPEPDYPVGTAPVGRLSGSGRVAVEDVPEQVPELRWIAGGEVGDHPDLEVNPFKRSVDRGWRRLSFTKLTKNASHDRDDSRAMDEEGSETLTEASTTAGQRSLYADLPAGAALGNLVHATMEAIDPTASPLADEVRRGVKEQLRFWPVPAAGSTDIVQSVTDALVPSIQTPLGPLAGNLRLADISPRDRLPELGFELPLHQASDEPGTLRDVGELLQRHLADGDPIREYGAQLAANTVHGTLRGFLNGSIDAVLRVPDSEGRHTYLVVDYKTNRLGGQDGVIWDYRPAVLPHAMMKSHYPLQSLLYSVALHRFLRWRLHDYDPQRHLGGILYLFVRGMCGPETPVQDGVPCGVFSWRPPAAMVVELSDLVSGAGR